MNAVRRWSSLLTLVNLRKLLHHLEVDRAVFFGVLAKIWGVISGPFTALLIIMKFTPEYQGYYYTFGSLLALQVFVELGLGAVIVQFASHEWSGLKMDAHGTISGDQEAFSRLVSLANITFKWYLAGGLLVAFGLGLGGYLFFLQSPSNTYIDWLLPWFSICLLTGINICFIPAWSLLEGCNQVSAVYTYRFMQGVIASMAIWIAIIAGAKLWSASVFTVVTILCSYIFLKYRYGNFIAKLLSTRSWASRIDWRKEIFPMQWRIAVSWISGYFVFSFFTPVIFHYHGPVLAGQFGMTWSVLLMVATLSSALLFPKIPRFGMLVSKRMYAELDSLFAKITKIFVAITLLSALSIWLAIYLLNVFKHHFASRLLPVLPMTLFLLAQVTMTLSMPFVIYLRAHKKEPIMWVSICGTVLIGLSTLILGRYYSVTAIGYGYLAVNIILVPIMVLIWQRCRNRWHKNGLSYC